MSALDNINLNGTRYDLAVPTEEMTQTAVNEWLDDHPEATTTVQDDSLTTAKYRDGSITAAKLSADVMIFYNTVAEMVADQDLIADKIVHVYGVCYPEYDGKDLDFIITDTANYYTIALDNGLYAKPIIHFANPKPLTIEAAYSIIKCGLSYFDRSNLAYPSPGATYGSIFADSVDTSGATMPIDCSTFVQACLMGVMYSNSKFVLPDNAQEPWGYQFPDGLPVSQIQSARTHGFTASELAFYGFLHGWLYAIDEGAGNVQSGDIIFTANAGTRPNEFLNIDHVQIVLNKIDKSSNWVRVLESGSGTGITNQYGNYVCKIGTYQCGSPTSVLYGMRVPLQSSTKPKNITSIRRRSFNLPYTLSGSPTGTTGTAYTTENFRAGELYTAVIKGNLIGIKNGWYPFMRLVSTTGSNIYNCVSYSGTINAASNTMAMVFTPLRDSTPSTVYNALQFGINNSSGSLTLTIDSFEVYKGVYVCDEDEQNVSVTIATGITETLKAIHGTKGRFDLTVPVSSYTGITIGTVDLYNYEGRMIPANVVSGTNITAATPVSVNILYAQNNLSMNIYSSQTGITSIRVRFDIDFGT